MFSFYRVEHSEEINLDLVKYTKNQNKSIHYGPWGLLDLFAPNEIDYMASISTQHALPYYKENRPFDSEINEIVMGPEGKSDQSIKEHFVFGCSGKHLINRYFPARYREILRSHGFHVGIYSSHNVHTSRFQSIMNIDKPFEYLGSINLV